MLSNNASYDFILISRLVYLICVTVLLVSFLFIYCCVRRKLSSWGGVAGAHKNVTKTALMEAMELSALRRSLPDV